MDTQLRLLTSPVGDASRDHTGDREAPALGAWRLSERTRDLGRQGVAEARAALAAARRSRPQHDRSAA